MQAEKDFINTSQNNEIPSDTPEVSSEGLELVDILVRMKLVTSKSDFRRLVEEKAITNLESGEKVADIHFLPQNGMSFKVGNRGFIKIT